MVQKGVVEQFCYNWIRPYMKAATTASISIIKASFKSLVSRARFAAFKSFFRVFISALTVFIFMLHQAYNLIPLCAACTFRDRDFDGVAGSC